MACGDVLKWWLPLIKRTKFFCQFHITPTVSKNLLIVMETCMIFFCSQIINANYYPFRWYSSLASFLRWCASLSLSVSFAVCVQCAFRFVSLFQFSSIIRESFEYIYLLIYCFIFFPSCYSCDFLSFRSVQSNWHSNSMMNWISVWRGLCLSLEIMMKIAICAMQCTQKWQKQ